MEQNGCLSPCTSLKKMPQYFVPPFSCRHVDRCFTFVVLGAKIGTMCKLGIKSTSNKVLESFSCNNTINSCLENNKKISCSATVKALWADSSTYGRLNKTPFLNSSSYELCIYTIIPVSVPDVVCNKYIIIKRSL